MRQLIFFLSVELNFLFYFILALASRKRFNHLKACCLFIGYPRTGHTLIAAILDANPHITIADEVDIISKAKQGYTRFMLYQAMYYSSKKFSEKKGCQRGGHLYKIEGSWQGNSTRLEIIGDKMPGHSMAHIDENPKILGTISNKLKLPIQLIHVVRNPFDVIASMHARSSQNSTKEANIDPKLVERFFKKATINQQILKNKSFNCITLFYEDMIAQPEKQIRILLDFLQVNFTDDYLLKCCLLVNPRIGLNRHQIGWQKEQIEDVLQRMQMFEFLKHYTFN